MGKTSDVDKNELEMLRAENERLRNAQPQMPNSSLNEELRKIRKQSTVNTLGIPYRDITDHKNIRLYTPLNKIIGPLHPHNAEKTMIHWAENGIQLYTQPRTQDQIEQYKQTETYKRLRQKHLETREHRHKASSKGSFDKFTDAIAKEVGVKASTLNRKPIKANV